MVSVMVSPQVGLLAFFGLFCPFLLVLQLRYLCAFLMIAFISI